MAVRTKMSRGNRAKQFGAFDALKGLQDALRLKEYEHERIVKGDIQEEKAREISDTLMSFKKGQVVYVTFFDKGLNCSLSGTARLDANNGILYVRSFEIPIPDILDIKVK